MPLMSHFCFYCSVRLGAIINGICSAVEAVIPLCLFWIVDGVDGGWPATVKKYQHVFDEQNYVLMVMEFIRKEPDTFVLIATTCSTFYIIFCVLMMFGAYKLHKWFLLPYIIFELGRLAVLVFIHIATMTMLKRRLNLGSLIAATICGGFVLLFLLYNWTTVVALFQIISIVHSDKYRTLYGDSPLDPLTASTALATDAVVESDIGGNNHNTVEYVQLYTPPDFAKPAPPLKQLFAAAATESSDRAPAPVDQRRHITNVVLGYNMFAQDFRNAQLERQQMMRKKFTDRLAYNNRNFY